MSSVKFAYDCELSCKGIQERCIESLKMMWYWQVNVTASLVQAGELQAEITAVVGKKEKTPTDYG